MQIDDISVIKVECSRERVKRDLETAVEVALARCDKEVGEKQAERAVGQRALSLRGKTATGPHCGYGFEHVGVEGPSGRAEHPPPAKADILIVDPWRQRQDDSKSPTCGRRLWHHRQQLCSRGTVSLVFTLGG